MLELSCYSVASAELKTRSLMCEFKCARKARNTQALVNRGQAVVVGVKGQYTTVWRRAVKKIATDDCCVGWSFVGNKQIKHSAVSNNSEQSKGSKVMGEKRIVASKARKRASR
jgi:hypothetical protein